MARPCGGWCCGMFVKFAGEQLTVRMSLSEIMEESEEGRLPQMDTDKQVISTDEDTN